MRILPTIATLLMGAVLIIVGAVGAFWYTERASTQEPSMPGEEESTPPPPPSADSATGPAVTEINRETLLELLSLVQAEHREAILESAEEFTKFVQQERANQAVLAAAYANKADDNAAVSTLMRRAAQKVLAETYLSQVIRRNLAPGYPSAAQTQEYYAANKPAFHLPDRVHLWQIFIPAERTGSAIAVTNAGALARQLARDLTNGRAEFRAIVVKHSKHLQSRPNEGYMGLLNVGELVPEIRTVVDGLAANEVSAPVQTDTGFHIVKRGDRVAGSQLTYDAVQNRIVAQMRQDAAAKIRLAAIEKMMATYPVSVDESALTQWRTELRSAEWPVILDTAASETP